MPRFPTNKKLQHPIFKLLILGTILIGLSISMSIVYLPIYLINSAHLDPITVGFIVGAGAWGSKVYQTKRQHLRLKTFIRRN
jgi:hypothetical protein